MSLYRQAGQARRRRRLAAAGAAASLVAVAVAVVFVAGAGGPPSHAERVGAARGAATQALDGLELVQIEYGQAVRSGRVIAPTEYQAARADVDRARRALSAHAADLAAIDPSALRDGRAVLDRVGAAVDRRADVAAAVRAARARIGAIAR